MACETAACDERRAPVASLGYTPRQAERTVLHQVIREHLETFLATTARADPGGLPAFLEQEFRGFLDCGVWARGFARFQCDGCHAETLVPFSCSPDLETMKSSALCASQWQAVARELLRIFSCQKARR